LQFTYLVIETETVAKHSSDLITEKDLREFVDNDSDFSFEMKVLAELRGLKFECSHSGTYQDPISDKIRQFDIRARKRQGSCTLRLGVECKNLRRNHPLLLSAVPRSAEEAFHDIVSHQPVGLQLATVRTEKNGRSVYKPGEMVAKKTDQVRRDATSNLARDDSATFEKLNQAVNSSRDLVREAAVNFVVASVPNFDAVVPVLVVPRGLLWQVDYAEDGKLLASPRQVTRSSLFLNHTWTINHPFGGVSYRLSHLEFITLDALGGVIDSWLSSAGFFVGYPL
jgi:hypothetical protein